MKTGVVFEGGGMRGLYSAGVIDAMLDHNFEPDVICGTSAGVTFGVNLKSKQRGRVLRYNTRFAGDVRYISLQSFLRTGDMVNREFAYDLLPRELDPFDNFTYMQTPTEFWATLTNVRTGQAEYHKITDSWAQMDAIRASASLPFISRKVSYLGEEYLDGGLVDNIPLGKCMELGCDRIIVVLTRPAGYVRNEHLTLLSRILYPRDKALQAAIARRNSTYMERLEEINRLEQEGRIIVIRPSRNVLVARLEKDPAKLQALYDLGLCDALRLWPDVEQYLRS